MDKEIIFAELQDLGEITHRKIFGHDGFAFGSSIFAFLIEGRIALKTERYKTDALPEGLAIFGPLGASREWITLPIDDDLRILTTYRALFEDSYNLAVEREREKQQKKARKIARGAAQPLSPKSSKAERKK